MSLTDPYEIYPSYETEHFLLRQAELSDAKSLLRCYSDPRAVKRMNADNCTSDFFFTTVEEVRSCIRFWQREYADRRYIRPAVVEKESGEPVGTLEIFGGDCGVLRVDLCFEFEREEYLAELYTLAVQRFFEDFPMEAMMTKAVPEAKERVRALRRLGFCGPEKFGSFDCYYRKERN